jgi:trimeric autotransporter adhesin
LTITDNSNNVAGSKQTVSLTGTGTGPTVSLNASTLPFSTQTEGTASTAQSVTLTNTGNASLTITSISVTGTNSADFSPLTSNTCGSSVAAGGNCTFSVTFKPSLIGAESAAVTITDNAPGSPQTVTLTGTGTASVANLSGATLNFGNQNVLTTSPSQTITLTDTGNLSLTITSITVTGTNAGDFAETTNCPISPTSVAAGNSCTITVTFTPSASGNRTAAVSITDNATAGSPQAVSLIGIGALGTVGLSATTLTFGSQSVGTTSTAQIVTLTNNGSSSLTVTSVNLGGTNPGSFGKSADTCTGATIPVTPPANTCTVGVTFTPTTSGSLTATLIFADSATNSPQTVSLTGTGGAPEAGLSPTASFNFGNQGDATSSSAVTYTLNNSGNAILNIASIGFTGTNPGDFSYNTTCGTAPTTLAGNNTSCTIAATFTPAAGGSRSGTLIVTDNSNNVAGSTQTAPLTGTGLPDIILNWDPSPNTGILGYNVFRGTTAGGESTTPIATEVAVGCTTLTICTYVDTAVVVGTKYFYYVTAVASNGTTQSVASNEASATAP